jgi:Flp pilus assembly pilin Flp
MCLNLRELSILVLNIVSELYRQNQENVKSFGVFEALFGLDRLFLTIGSSFSTDLQETTAMITNAAQFVASSITAALANRKGVTSLEYGVLAAFVIAAVAAAMNAFSGSLTNAFTQVTTALTTAITGAH